jgi:hypothetical protein
VPIFEPIIQAVWDHHSPRTVLRGPTPETQKHVVAQRVEDELGETTGSLVEYLRRDASGRAIDTRHRLVGEGEVSMSYDPYAGRDNGFFGFLFAPWGNGPRSSPGNGPRSSGHINPLPPPRRWEPPIWRGDPN